MTTERTSPIALVGLMGAGKSAVARALGERLGATVADLDEMAETEAGATVAGSFARDGEAAFRRLEGRLLMQALASGAGVIACGGGIVLDPQHRTVLRSRCRVVWLEVSPETAARRVAGQQGLRPLLGGADPLPRLEELLAARRALYEETTHLRLSTENRTADEVAVAVLRALEERAE
jgi:shikimate kinase